LNFLLIFHLFLVEPFVRALSGSRHSTVIKICDWLAPWYWKMPVEKGH
jgi:hypothetical protein